MRVTQLRGPRITPVLHCLYHNLTFLSLQAVDLDIHLQVKLVSVADLQSWAGTRFIMAASPLDRR